MGIQLTADQVLTMAPDASSSAAGKKLANAKNWKNLGQSPEALWGECQGSALYQVRVDLSSLTIQCSCPSRKLPCKHGLGLLLLAVNTPSTVPTTEPPEWITAWLAKRAATSKRKEAKTEAKEPASSESDAGRLNSKQAAAQKKTAEKRLSQVTMGIDRLDLWLNDIVRNGLGKLETQPAKFWASQKALMEDAQAKGLANRVARMADIPNSSPDWPEKLLAHLGQLALLTQAFRRLDQLDPALQEDVRQLIGWSLKEDEVIMRGEKVTDNWLILGQTTEDEDRGRSQRTWLLGTTSKRQALLLQFSFAGAAFAEQYPIGIQQTADLVFWPGAAPHRAILTARRGDVSAITESFPTAETIEDFFEEMATTLAHQPWRDRFLCTLHNVIPFCTGDQWYICDSNNQMLPLVEEHWKLMALAGGWPVDFVGEWDGEALLPLGMLADHKYHAL
ncbi:MAG TPA: SWIM zinc finger family protein [Ktedonosporobacter sp.]|nr:SWIM zinc finger family protein [Ktedonosporobacter sp.]